ncbi:hypothetical protein IWQ51_002467 [Labrenzia sp. EL_142]|nr:hypothetical protein [Labrenzia sp. EL_142]
MKMQHYIKGAVLDETVRMPSKGSVSNNVPHASGGANG